MVHKYIAQVRQVQMYKEKKVNTNTDEMRGQSMSKGREIIIELLEGDGNQTNSVHQ